MAGKIARVREIASSIGLLPSRADRICAALESAQQSSSATLLLPELRSQRFWTDERACFPEVAELEARFEDILAEFTALRRQDEIRRYTETDLVSAGVWGQFHLRMHGTVLEENAARCPVTTSILLRGGPYVGVTYFSVHAPGTRVKGHFGPGNYRVRCHLGLDVPERSGMRLGGELLTWTTGKCVLFDDSFFHEVWNEDTRSRSILLADFWHPDLTEDEIKIFAHMMQMPAEMSNTQTRLSRASSEARLSSSLWDSVVTETD